MDCCCSSPLPSLSKTSCFSSTIKPRPLTTALITTNIISINRKNIKRKPRTLQVFAHSISYQRFIHFALSETERCHTLLVPSPLHLFPWGGKLTSESLKFFSPIVIWTKFPPSEDRYNGLYSAFTEYYKAWLDLINQAPEETDASQITFNREAQRKYLTWRAEKDPGRGVLRRLIGEELAEDLVSSFLFNGLDELGSKGFLDYFPEYSCEDGSINEKRSILGRSFENRPWNERGEFIGGF